MFLKVCGITRLPDALHAVEHGSTALGFVLWPLSPRRITREAVVDIVGRLPSTVTTVGVFVNEASDEIVRTMQMTQLTHVQLHGDEPATYADLLAWPILRSVTVGTADEVVGTALARVRQVVLAGGLTPAYVAEAIACVRPFGVDVSSGVEDAPGIKNAEKVRLFLASARRAMMVNA